MINRIWMHHFGEGFVRTPDDMGVQSEPPSHPELLDYLAARFMDDGWSMKQMHKLIMLSSAYQQSSDTNASTPRRTPTTACSGAPTSAGSTSKPSATPCSSSPASSTRRVGGKPVNLTDEPYSNRRSVYGYIDRGNFPS